MASLSQQDWSSLMVNENDTRDDDNISLTSTVAEVNDEDKLWTVDCILSEREKEGRENKGVMEYLISWEGFPLHEATWEPVESFSEGLLAQWLEQKDEIKRGERTAFDVKEYENAIVTAANEHNERHLKRNAKRQRLGLQLTAPFAAEEESVDGSSGSIFSRDGSESSDEAMEIDEIEPGNAEKIGDPPKPLKQNIFKGIPTATAVNSTKESTRRQSTGQLAGPGKQASSGPSPVVGYQGTARKTSISDKDLTRLGEARRPSVGGKDSAQSGASRKPSISGGKTQTKPRQATVKTTNVAGPSSTLPKKFQAVRTTRPAAIPPMAEPTKIRKRRSSLKESMMDITKEPKLFRSHRKRNAARKRGQELNDTAPLNAAAIPASFFITNDKPKQSATAETPAAQSPTISSADDQVTNDSNKGHPTAGPTNETKKSRKSVRFTEDAIFEEPAEIESPLEVPEPAISASDVTQGPKRKLSLAAYQERTGNQAVAKTTSFGPEGSRCIRVLLNGITRAQLPWLKSFMEDTAMHFRMICVADDFFGTPERFYETHNKLASGVVECSEPEDISALEAVGKNLRRTQAAFYLARKEYSILIYPSQCDAWAGLADPTSPSPTSLNHVVFRPPVPIDPGLYRPLVSSDESNDGSGSVDIDVCLKVMNELVDVDVEALRTKPNFYLIHYPSEIYLFQMVALWLRSIVPGCRIFTSGHTGSWAKFVQEGNKDGTVILHESVLKIIRKIPRLWDSLNYGNHNLWYLTSSGQEPTLSPWEVSGTPENDSFMSLPRLKLTRLFPYGCAILITPSFAVSEPAELCRLLSWFKEASRAAPYVLVGCADFPEYLRGLVLDKAQEADQFKRTQSSDLFLEKELIDRGLSRDDLKDRLHAWELICDIVHAGKGYGYDLEEASEDIRKTAWASESIDSNDEQSLFNWFAWWSTTRLANYRKFYVIGSRARGISRARRTVRIPNYATHVVGDPDVAFARFNLNSTESRNDPAPYVFQSTMFPSDRAADFKSWLIDLTRSHKMGWTRLFVDPVSWVDVKMADSFEDPTCEYATFTNWFRSLPKFHQGGNTLIGLFYTIDTDWTGSARPENSGRHPWIAVYRPVNPHFVESYKDTELFFWDCDFARRSRGSSARDPPPFLPMQRRLIEFVREEASTRFAEYSLKKVWIGDFPIVTTPDLSHPIDVTCRSLDYLLKNTYDLLNPFEPKLKDQGWKLVEKEGVYNLWARPSGKEEADAFPKAVGDMEHPEVTIIHAPQGDGQGQGQGQSQCRNQLYDAAFRARKADHRALTLDYQYQPTLKWYHALKEEGRSHSYIMVDSWDKALDDLIKR